MAKLHLFVVLIVVSCQILQAKEGNETKNDSEITGRSGRYGYSKTYENRLPATNYEDMFNESPAPYPEFSDRRTPYEIPTGFDQFVPDKSGKPKYSYGSSGFYLPYPPNVQPDYAVDEIEDKTAVTKTPATDSVALAPKLKDMLLKAVRYFFGENDPDSVLIDQKPTFLTGIKQLFSDPMVALAAIVIPLSFLLANFIPFLTKMVMKSSLGPAVTTTIANTVARGLESPAAEKILESIHEYGAKVIEEPRCLQRFFCQAAKSHIESRNSDSWSAHKIVRKLVQAVDEKLWNSFGLNMLYHSLQGGHCKNLPCSIEFKAFPDKPIMNKLRILFSELLNLTKTEVL